MSLFKKNKIKWRVPLRLGFVVRQNTNECSFPTFINYLEFFVLYWWFEVDYIGSVSEVKTENLIWTYDRCCWILILLLDHLHLRCVVVMYCARRGLANWSAQLRKELNVEKFRTAMLERWAELSCIVVFSSTPFHEVAFIYFFGLISSYRGLNLPCLLFLFRELKEARLAATSPHQSSQPGSLPRAGRKLVGKSAARYMSFGFPEY